MKNPRPKPGDNTSDYRMGGCSPARSCATAGSSLSGSGRPAGGMGCMSYVLLRRSGWREVIRNVQRQCRFLRPPQRPLHDPGEQIFTFGCHLVAIFPQLFNEVVFAAVGNLEIEVLFFQI